MILIMKWITYKSYSLSMGKQFIVLIASLVIFFLFDKLSLFFAKLNQNLDSQDFLNLFVLYCSVLFGLVIVFRKYLNLVIKTIITAFMLFSGYLLVMLIFPQVDCNGKSILYSHSWAYVVILSIYLIIALYVVSFRTYIIRLLTALIALFIIYYYPFLFG